MADGQIVTKKRSYDDIPQVDGTDDVELTGVDFCL